MIIERKYRQLSFYTLRGITKFIDLGDFSYGEWIVYDGRGPKYHVNIFDEQYNSNLLIKSLIENERETLYSIIHKISINEGVKLSLGHRPLFIEIVQKSELVDLELDPLPERWVKNIIE
jgi:hypothetical protein